jgi:hypothetical protein
MESTEGRLTIKMSADGVGNGERLASPYLAFEFLKERFQSIILF